MSLETKGTIKYDPDVKPGDAEFTIECKPLGICEGSHGDGLEMMINDLSARVKQEITQEFGIPRCDIQIVKYTMSITYDVSAPVNRTLGEYGAEPVREDVLALEKKIRDYAEKTGQDPQTVLDDLEKEAGVGKKRGEGA